MKGPLFGTPAPQLRLTFWLPPQLRLTFWHPCLSTQAHFLAPLPPNSGSLFAPPHSDPHFLSPPQCCRSRARLSSTGTPNSGSLFGIPPHSDPQFWVLLDPHLWDPQLKLTFWQPPQFRPPIPLHFMDPNSCAPQLRLTFWHPHNSGSLFGTPPTQAHFLPPPPF